MAERSAAAAYGRALALLAAGSVAMLVAFALPWATAQVPLLDGAEGATRTVEVAGRELFPMASAAGWLCLAGLGGILATRTWGRVVVGGIVALGAAAVLAAVVVFVTDPAGAVAATTPGSTDALSVSMRPWWLLAGAGAVVAAFVGVLAVLRGRRWPSMGARYERRDRRVTAISAWDALDRGIDPTETDHDPGPNRRSG